MNELNPESMLKSIPQLEQYAEDVSRSIHQEVLAGGEQTRNIADFFHGTWLGHPLHAVLTDVVVTTWSLGSLFDLIASRSRSRRQARRMQRIADRMVEIGTATAIPTALAGVTDFSTIPMRALRTGAAHGFLNAVALVLYSISLTLRKLRLRRLATAFSSAGMGVILVSAWLGGELSYRYRVGVDKTTYPEDLTDWTDALDEAELMEGEPRRVEVAGQPVLLYRDGQGEVFAIGAVCAHEGGPLEKGKIDGMCVECPWHQSVYDLRDGSVVHGPATYAVPNYHLRIQHGKIQVRVPQGS